MKLKKQLLLISLILLSFGQVFCQMIILSGPEKGSYNRFADDIVTVLGEKNGIKLLNRTTGGSANNFKQLTDPGPGDKMALIQSDYLNLMKAEDKLKNTSKTGSLKVVLQLATEEMHFVARKSSGLKKLQDLENKKVAFGNEDQGSLATGKLIRERSKVNWTTFYAGYDQLIRDLTENKIDAFLIVGSAPVNLLEIDPQVMTDGGTLLELEDFNGWAKYYENDTIYSSDYKWLEKDVPTFGVRTLLVVNEAKLTSTEKQTVEAIKSGIIQNLDILRKQGHPKWKDVIIPDEPGIVTETKTTPVKTPDQVSSVTKDAVVYKVQIYSRNYQQAEEQVLIAGKTYKSWCYSHLGAYRYTIGEFTYLSSAVELQNACRKSGYEEAFVAAFKNNERSTDPDLFK
jgi:TRAP transporter TAXI family solute receptor